jgi:hypothetical protein
MNMTEHDTLLRRIREMEEAGCICDPSNELMRCGIHEIARKFMDWSIALYSHNLTEGSVNAAASSTSPGSVDPPA